MKNLTRTVLVITVLLAANLVTGTQVASAQIDCSDPIWGASGCDAGGGGTGGGGGPSTPPRYLWKECKTCADTILFFNPGFCALGENLWVWKIWDSVDGKFVTGATEDAYRWACVTIDNPPPPPPPPSADDVFARARVPGVQFDLNPNKGLVGLDSEFNYTGAVTSGAQDFDANGWTVTVTLQVERFCWNFGDGAATVCVDSTTAAGARARHLYTKKADFNVTLTVMWHATWTATDGVVTLNGNQGSRPFRATQTYPVIEIRSVNGTN